MRKNSSCAAPPMTVTVSSDGKKKQGSKRTLFDQSFIFKTGYFREYSFARNLNFKL